MPLWHPWVYLARLVIIVVHRLWSWRDCRWLKINSTSKNPLGMQILETVIFCSGFRTLPSVLDLCSPSTHAFCRISWTLYFRIKFASTMQFSCDLIRPWVTVLDNMWDTCINDRDEETLKTLVIFYLRSDLISTSPRPIPSGVLYVVSSSTSRPECSGLAAGGDPPLPASFILSFHLKGCSWQLPEWLWSFFTLRQFRPYLTLSCTLC